MTEEKAYFVIICLNIGLCMISLAPGTLRSSGDEAICRNKLANAKFR